MIAPEDLQSLEADLIRLSMLGVLGIFKNMLIYHDVLLQSFLVFSAC